MQSGFFKRIPLSQPAPGCEQVLCHVTVDGAHGILAAVHPCALALIRGPAQAPFARWQLPCSPISACEGEDGRIYALTEDGCVRVCVQGAAAPPSKKAKAGKAKADDDENIGGIDSEPRVVPDVGRTSIVWQGRPSETRQIFPLDGGMLVVVGQPPLGKLRATLLQPREGGVAMHEASSTELDVGIDAPSRFAIASRFSPPSGKRRREAASHGLSLCQELFDAIFPLPSRRPPSPTSSLAPAPMLLAAGGSSGKLWFVDLRGSGGGAAPLPPASAPVSHLASVGSASGMGGCLALAMADCSVTIAYPRAGGAGGGNSLHWTTLALPGTPSLGAFCASGSFLVCA